MFGPLRLSSLLVGRRQIPITLIDANPREFTPKKLA
jgi:hypothetical protein